MLNIGSNINEVRVDGSVKALARDLTAFREFGLTAAEISVHGLDAVKNGHLDRRQVKDILAILSDFPFRYSVHAPNPLNLMDRSAISLHEDVLFASLEFAAVIGARCLVYHPGRYLPEERFAVSGPLVLSQAQQKELLEQEAAILQKAADRFQGIVIAMENARPYLFHSPYCYAELPSQIVSQIKRIDRQNVGMTLDFGHLHLAAKFYRLDMVAEVKHAAPYIAHCHVHDNFGSSVYYNEKIQTHQLPFGKGDSHMPPGCGTIPFRELFSQFIGNYKGLLICELRSRYFDSTGQAKDNLVEILRGIGGQQVC